MKRLISTLVICATVAAPVYGAGNICLGLTSSPEGMPTAHFEMVLINNQGRSAVQNGGVLATGSQGVYRTGVQIERVPIVCLILDRTSGACTATNTADVRAAVAASAGICGGVPAAILEFDPRDLVTLEELRSSVPHFPL